MNNRHGLPWPAVLLEAVGAAYREEGARGGGVEARVAAAETAYLAAGVTASDLYQAVPAMILHLADTRFDWLLGPAMDRLEREGRQRRAAARRQPLNPD